jgi:hypothetical protein
MLRAAPVISIRPVRPCLWMAKLSAVEVRDGGARRGLHIRPVCSNRTTNLHSRRPQPRSGFSQPRLDRSRPDRPARPRRFLFQPHRFDSHRDSESPCDACHDLRFSLNAEPYSTVREVIRLMQTGDLLAATAAIQHGLSGAAATEPSTAAELPDRGPIKGTVRVLDEMRSIAGDAPIDGSPAPASTPEERTKFNEHTCAGSAGTRRYKLFIPSAYRGQPLPLVVMLHGCTQTPDDLATDTRMNMLAEERARFIVYPAQPQTANMSKCWNWFKASNQHRDQGVHAIIAGLVRELLLTYGLDTGCHLFSPFERPITITRLPNCHVRGLASFNTVVEPSRKRTVIS